MFSFKNLLFGIFCTCFLSIWTGVHASQMKNILDSPEIIITAAHQTVSSYEPYQTLSVQTQIELSHSLTALGMIVMLPPDWTYLGTSGTNPSEVAPKIEGRTVQFAWINNLDLNQLTFSYSLRAGSLVDQDETITACVIYRFETSNERKQDVLPNPLVIKARNIKPNPPDLVSPANHETGISLSPTLVSGSFLDPNEGDSHQGTDWELCKDVNDFQNLIFSIHTENDKLNLSLPDFILIANSIYYWRIRHFDNNGEPSEWSVGQFETILETDLDDGIPIAQKVDNTVDMDNDGVPDNQQASIKSLNSVVGDVKIGLKSTSPDDCAVLMVRSIDPVHSILETLNRPAELPFGMLAFKLAVDEPGDSSIINIYYSQALPENVRWYMYDFQNGWQSYIPQLSNDRKKVTIHLIDGGDGDADGIENGIIVDPSGPGIPQSPDSPHTPRLDETIDNGSCFINSIGWKK